LVAAEQYERLVRRGPETKDLVELLANSPLRDVPLDLSRTSDHGRDVQL